MFFQVFKSFKFCIPILVGTIKVYDPYERRMGILITVISLLHLKILLNPSLHFYELFQDRYSIQRLFELLPDSSSFFS